MCLQSTTLRLQISFHRFTEKNYTRRNNYEGLGNKKTIKQVQKHFLTFTRAVSYLAVKAHKQYKMCVFKRFCFVPKVGSFYERMQFTTTIS